MIMAALPTRMPTAGAPRPRLSAAGRLSVGVRFFLLLSLLAGAVGARAEAASPEPAGTPLPAHLPSMAASQVVLPIEVLGPDGYTASVSVEVPKPGEVDRLYLRIHRPAYRDASVNPGRGPKASVRLNNGPWVGITNETVEVFEHEAEYGGLNGGYHTVRMTIPISALGSPRSGANTLSFRFNGTDGHTIGYRVLELNLLRAGGSEILPPSAFREDDPSTWAPISSRPADIAEGRDLWYNARLVDEPGGPQIRATCSSCHAEDGRDLWYFAYSNQSIVERSKFHGLSQSESEKIASYIRSLQDSDPSYAFEAPGRPWNPPYQPGPGLDALPARQWAAGAGLEWVLESDEDIIPYMFPNGITPEAVAADGRLNMREIPIAIQFPDWNEWLPEIHPIDIWGNTFVNDPSNRAYLNARATLSGGVDTRTVARTVSEISNEMRRFFQERGSQAPYRGNNDIPEVVRRHRSQFHWATMKTWELMQEFDLEGLAPQVYGEYGEARSWLGQARNIFELAPHLTTNKRAVAHPWQDRLVGKYFSTVWYHVQLVVNSGNVREVHQIKPVDWNYHPAHIVDVSREGGPAHPVRMMLSLAKLYQLASHYEDNKIADAFGLRWKQQHPWRFNPLYSPKGDVNPGRLALVYDAMLNAYMDRIEHIPTNAWPRTDLQPATFNGPWGNQNILKSPTAQSQGRHAELWYQMIPVYREAGVRERTLNRLIGWGEAMWPRGDWDALRVEGGEDEDPPGTEPPVAANDVAEVTAGGHVTIDVLANDTAAGGGLDPASVAIASAPAHGRVAIDRANGRVTYTHNGSATTTDAFTYTVADEAGRRSDPATVAISITPDGPSDPDDPSDPGGPSDPETACCQHALAFDGQNDLVALPEIALSGDFTLEAWVWVPEGGSVQGSILGQRDRKTGLMLNNGHVALFAAGRNQIRAKAAIPESSWTHVAVVRSGQALRLYLNGTLNTESQQGGFGPFTVQALGLGRRGHLTGRLAEVRLWTTARTAAQIATGRDAAITSGPGLAASWRFNEEAAEQAVRDASGNGRHGTLGASAAAGSDDPVRVGFDGDTPPPAETRLEQRVELQAGWNTVALWVAPEEPAFASVFGTTSAVVVKDAAGQVFAPGFEIDQLGAWRPTQAYEVYVQDDTTITVQGERVPAQTAITLRAGWNLLPYLLDTPQPVADALAPILSDLNYVLDRDGGVFAPSEGHNTLGQLQPGRGYRVHVAKDVTFTYPVAGRGVASGSAEVRRATTAPPQP